MIPFFSIIIPLYNKERFIQKTLQHVLDQTFTDFEIIIVDDGSTDNSLIIANEFKDKRITIYPQTNKGASDARNFGIKKSTGKYIALLDADDYWKKNHLLELKKLIEMFPKAGLFCNNYEINYNGKFIKPATFNFKYDKQCLIIEDFFTANIINFIASSSSVAFLKADFINLGSYNTTLRTGQDIDLWIRFALYYKIAFNPIITMCYNNFDIESLSRSNYNTDRYQLINTYQREEKNNASLKLYLDINRYALAIRCRINNESKLYKKLKNEIDYSNLNYKQKTLLFCPKFLLKTLKFLQLFFINKSIYFTAHS